MSQTHAPEATGATAPKEGRELLFRPFRHGALALRNRLAMAPMTRKRSPGGVPTEEVAAYYRRRGEGGIGLIFSEGTFVDHPTAGAEDGGSYRDIPGFAGRDALAGWERVRLAVAATGAAMMPQLWHLGEVRRRGMGPDPAVPGVGPRRLVEAGEVLVEALAEPAMEEIAAAYARSARWARELGFDGVALHGAHGYLLDQFFWPEANDRQDGHGGDMRARSRFACRVVAAIREAVGPGFPIVFRFSQWKMTDYGARIARTPAELEVLLLALADAGVDLFDVSTRRFWEPAFEGSGDSLAAWTRRLSGRPVIAVGSIGLDQPHQSKHYRNSTSIDAKVTGVGNVVEAMARGDFDLAAVGRALLADPQWAAKVAEGRMAEIAPFDRAALERYA